MHASSSPLWSENAFARHSPSRYFQAVSRSSSGSDRPTADLVEWNRSLMRSVEEEALQEVTAAEEEALQSRDLSVPEPGLHEELHCYG